MDEYIDAVPAGALLKSPLAADLDVRFIDVPLAGDGSLVFVESLEKLGRVTDHLTADRGVIDRDAALGHHLVEIAQAEIAGQIHVTQSRITDRSKCLRLNTPPSVSELRPS
jgi:hypothetical protein